MPALLCFPPIVLFFVKEEKENPEFHEKEKKKTLFVTTQGIIKAGTSDPTSERHRIGGGGSPTSRAAALPSAQTTPAGLANEVQVWFGRF